MTDAAKLAMERTAVPAKTELYKYPAKLVKLGIPYDTIQIHGQRAGGTLAPQRPLAPKSIIEVLGRGPAPFAPDEGLFPLTVASLGHHCTPVCQTAARYWAFTALLHVRLLLGTEFYQELVAVIHSGSRAVVGV